MHTGEKLLNLPIVAAKPIKPTLMKTATATDLATDPANSPTMHTVQKSGL